MELRGLLAERRADVLARWRALIVERTPRSGPSSPAGARDPFQDPIGVSLSRATAAVYELLCEPRAASAAPASLDEFVRIRSVQDVSASDAVRFVFLVRTAIRDVLGDELDRASRDERFALDVRIDEVVLRAFEAYVRSREKLFDVRAREVVSRSFVLLDRARRLIEEREPADPERVDGGGT